MKNTDLKQKYDEMHKAGRGSWFDDGSEERQAIIDMGQPWQSKTVMEIGCGEGQLLSMLSGQHAVVRGCDYSLEAITTAKNRYPYLDVMCCDWTEYPDSRRKPDVLVMQGVLEHMDDWQAALDGMILKFEPETIITSMPCFLNIRGIVWMTLDMLGAVMSKTDLHFINPWELSDYCKDRKYWPEWETIDREWAADKKMANDLLQRIPLALEDGALPVDISKIKFLINWLLRYGEYAREQYGAVSIYKISL